MEQAEKLCDDICLLNRSRKVLEGSLREVKRGFGRNAVALRGEGLNDALANSALVVEVKTNSDDLESLLAPGANAQELLRNLIDAGAIITRFEQVEPS